MVSFPPRPQITSFPLVPLRRSAPAVPRRVHTSVRTEVESLPGFGSASFPWTWPASVILPPSVVVATNVTEALAPDAIVPRLHTTGPAPVHDPWLGSADTNCTESGSVSVMTTSVAWPGPPFRTVITYVRLPPTLSGSGESAIRTDRSAGAPTSTHSPEGEQVTVAPNSNLAQVEPSCSTLTSVTGKPRCPETSPAAM